MNIGDVAMSDTSMYRALQDEMVIQELGDSMFHPTVMMMMMTMAMM
jgi:hypothetical protein